MTKPTRQIVTMLACASAALPSIAHACPVCFSVKNEGARVAFLATTIFMTALPLVMIGGLIYWFAVRSVELAKEEEAEALAAIDGPEEVGAPDPMVVRAR